jgi:DNA modification methylase
MELDRVICSDALEFLRGLPDGCADAFMTDPPYPNNAGHFVDAIPAAREALQCAIAPVAVVFWSEMERPPVPLPLVAVHIWHRVNANGRPYEPAYHYNVDGQKRRSCVKAQCFVNPGVGPGSREYAGHPTQKPVAVMEWLLSLLGLPKGALVVDPFCGSGSTLLACANLGLHYLGCDISEEYVALAQDRLRGVRSRAGGQAQFDLDATI